MDTRPTKFFVGGVRFSELSAPRVGGGTLLAGSLLYLVDQDKKPVKPEIRIAVEAAFRWSVREYRNMDAADLAAMTEAVALGMSKRLEEIQSPRRYSFVALTGFYFLSTEREQDEGAYGYPLKLQLQ